MSTQANLRKWHRIVGIVAAPLFLITAVGGTVLLLRKTGWLEREFVHDMEKLHNLEIIGPYVGLITVAAMFFMAITGVILFILIAAAKRRAAASSPQHN